MTKLFVATPAYNGLLHMIYHRTVLSLAKDMQLMTGIAVDSLVTRARNGLITRFLTTDCTHLLFLDADVGVEAGGIKKLLDRGKDAIAALVSLKNETDRVSFPVGRVVSREGELVEIEYVPTGCLLLSRKAIDALCEDAPTYERLDQPGVTYYEACRTAVGRLARREHVRLIPEDFFMCMKLRSKGFKIWADPTIHTEHVGQHVWSFNGDANIIDVSRSADEARMPGLHKEASRTGVGAAG